MVKCNEVLHAWDGSERFVCRAERFTEHTHAELMPYIEPLAADAQVTDEDEYGCIFLVDEGHNRKGA